MIATANDRTLSLERKFKNVRWQVQLLLACLFRTFQYINEPIEREKEVKKWRREKKEALIDTFNLEWKFLNFELFESWPPNEMWHRKDL